MASLVRLVTEVDIDDRTSSSEVLNAPMLDGPASEGAEPAMAPGSPQPGSSDPCAMSLSAMHLAVLDDGRRVPLLGDRGWTASGPADIWRRTSVEEVEADARMVVGPDEPYGSLSQAATESSHWADLAGRLRQHGVTVTAEELSRLPHDIELSDRLLIRISGT
jgi:hypothetical protein